MVLHCAPWLEQMLHPQMLSKVVGWAVDIIEKEYGDVADGIVGCGVSGTVPASIISYMMNKKLCIVRKVGESTHSPFNREGDLPNRYVIIDDLVDSGETITRILAAMSEPKNCVALLLYACEHYETAYTIKKTKEFMAKWPWIQVKIYTEEFHSSENW